MQLIYHTMDHVPLLGDRPGVPNVGLVLTDGESNVNKEDTIPEANAARQEGIILFAVGIGIKPETVMMLYTSDDMYYEGFLLVIDLLLQVAI